MEMLFIEMRTTETKVSFGKNPRVLEMLKLRYLERKERGQVGRGILLSKVKPELQRYRTGDQIAGNSNEVGE